MWHSAHLIVITWKWSLNSIKPLITQCVLILMQQYDYFRKTYNWAPSSEFVSSSIPSWQILTAHAQPFRGARDLAFCLKVPLDSLLVWASSEGSGEIARMRRLAWTFAARISDKYQIRLTWSNYLWEVWEWICPQSPRLVSGYWVSANFDHCMCLATFVLVFSLLFTLSSTLVSTL